MIKFAALLAGLAALSSCGPTPYDFATTVPPSQWTDDERSLAFTFPTRQLCWHYRQGRSLPNIDGRIQPSPYSRQDFAVLDIALKQRGLSNRDLEIIRDPRADFGTGQTPLGLDCSLPNVEVVNRSFVAGRHIWQVRTASGQFIYFEGDGTPEGMRVTSWN